MAEQSKYYKDFQYYHRCTKCDKAFRNYEDEMTCPFCKEKKYVKSLFDFDEDTNENNKT